MKEADLRLAGVYIHINSSSRKLKRQINKRPLAPRHQLPVYTFHAPPAAAAAAAAVAAAQVQNHLLLRQPETQQ